MMMVNLPHQLIRCLVEKIYSLFKLSLSNYTGAFKFVWITGNKLHIIFSQYIKWKLRQMKKILRAGDEYPGPRP